MFSHAEVVGGKMIIPPDTLGVNKIIKSCTVSPMTLINDSQKALRSKEATLKQAVTRELCTAYWLACSVGCSLVSVLSYNPACEPLESVKTLKNGNAVKFMVATFDLPLISKPSCHH